MGPSGPTAVCSSRCMDWDFLPIPMSLLSLGGIGALGASQGGGKLCLHHQGKDALGHKPFQSRLLPLGAGQQHLKPNELSPTAPPLSKLCHRLGCPVRFPLTQTVFRCAWLITKLSLVQRPTLVLRACLREEVPGRAAGARTDGGDFWFKFFTDWLFAGGIYSWFCFVMALLL